MRICKRPECDVNIDHRTISAKYCSVPCRKKDDAHNQKIKTAMFKKQRAILSAEKKKKGTDINPMFLHRYYPIQVE